MSQSQDPVIKPPLQKMSIEDLVNKQHLELVVEVKALAHAVSQLHTIFVKRRLLYWLLGAETALVAAALAFISIFIGIENAHQNELVDHTVGTCKIRNAQVDSTRAFLNAEFAIQAESGQLSALYLDSLHLKITPQERDLARKVTQDQNKALRQWFTSQPPDVPCAQFKTGG